MDLYLPWNSSHVLSAAFDHSDQNFLAHDERCIHESAVGVGLILTDLSVEIRLCKEIGIELGDRWDDQMSEEFSLFASRHHPSKGVFILATQHGIIISSKIFGRDPGARCAQIAANVLLHLVDFLRRLVQEDGSLNVADAVFDKEVNHTRKRRCRVVEAFVADFAIIARIVLEERHCVSQSNADEQCLQALL